MMLEIARTLEQYVAECVEAEAERRRQAEQKRDADDQGLETIFNEAIADAKRKLAFVVPVELQQFVVFTGRRPTDTELRANWIPSLFAIRAPGLAEIAFEVGAAGDRLTLKAILVGEKRFADWTRAVVRAHEIRETRGNGTGKSL